MPEPITLIVWFVVALLVLFTLVAIARAIRIVPQATAVIVERLGKYDRTLDAGLHFLIPFIDRPRSVVDLRELGNYDWRLSDKNVWKVEQLLLVPALGQRSPRLVRDALVVVQLVDGDEPPGAVACPLPAGGATVHAGRTLQRRRLLQQSRASITATPEYTVLRPWVRTKR